jgi:hypothetical protein
MPRNSIRVQILGFYINVNEEDIIYADIDIKVGHIHIKLQFERYWRLWQLFMGEGVEKEN